MELLENYIDHGTHSTASLIGVSYVIFHTDQFEALKLSDHQKRNLLAEAIEINYTNRVIRIFKRSFLVKLGVKWK